MKLRLLMMFLGLATIVALSSTSMAQVAQGDVTGEITDFEVAWSGGPDFTSTANIENGDNFQVTFRLEIRSYFVIPAIGPIPKIFVPAGGAVQEITLAPGGVFNGWQLTHKAKPQQFGDYVTTSSVSYMIIQNQQMVWVPLDEIESLPWVHE